MQIEIGRKYPLLSDNLNGFNDQRKRDTRMRKFKLEIFFL